MRSRKCKFRGWVIPYDAGVTSCMQERHKITYIHHLFFSTEPSWQSPGYYFLADSESSWHVSSLWL